MDSRAIRLLGILPSFNNFTINGSPSNAIQFYGPTGTDRPLNVRPRTQYTQYGRQWAWSSDEAWACAFDSTTTLRILSTEIEHGLTNFSTDGPHAKIASSRCGSPARLDSSTLPEASAGRSRMCLLRRSKGKGTFRLCTVHSQHPHPPGVGALRRRACMTP
ncbi:hypothetical protein VTK26DRAFT_5529 [Humicola hyalothermophila]